MPKEPEKLTEKGKEFLLEYLVENDKKKQAELEELQDALIGMQDILDHLSNYIHMAADVKCRPNEYLTHDDVCMCPDCVQDMHNTPVIIDVIFKNKTVYEDFRTKYCRPQ